MILSIQAELQKCLIISGYYVNNSIVVHKMASNVLSTFLDETNINRIDRLFYSYRNEMVRKRRKGLIGIIKHIYRCIIDSIKVLIFSKNYKFRRIKSIQKGLFCSLVFFPKIEYVVSKK